MGLTPEYENFSWVNGGQTWTYKNFKRHKGLTWDIEISLVSRGFMQELTPPDGHVLSLIIHTQKITTY